MDFFEDLKDKAQTLTQAGVSKSKHLVEVTKLKLSNASEVDTIRKAYQEMGKLYYAERGMAPEPAYAVHCDTVKTAKNVIRHNNETLTNLKNQGVVVTDDFVDIEDIDFVPADAPESPEEL